MGLSTQILGSTIGWLAVGWVAVQAAVSSVRTVQRRIQWRREYAAARAEFCRRIESTARAARATKAIPDWNGWRQFRVAAIVDEAREVKSFYLTPVDGQTLAPFSPGQYLTFRLPPAVGEPPLVRCYSLSDRPRQDFFRVTVKRLVAPAACAEARSGQGSSFFHDRVRVGDALDTRAPAGAFFLDPLAREPVALIGAGIGITPLVSMLESIVHGGRGREVHVLFAFRNGREHPFKAQLEKLAESYPHLRLHVSYSQPQAGDVIYKDYNHRGRLTIERVREVLPSNNFRFYVCGPSALMDTLVPALWAWGVPESHVHFEAFGPASVASASRAAPQAACDIRFERSTRLARWDGAFKSLLEFAEAAGVTMPSGCRAGNCGECLTAIRRGAVTPLKQPGFPVPPDHCLTCICVPSGDLVLDA
jgi:ferredoxin-NADP reductase